MDVGSSDSLVELHPKVLPAILLVKVRDWTDVGKQRTASTLLSRVDALSNQGNFPKYEFSSFLLDTDMIPVVGGVDPTESVFRVIGLRRTNP
jgi:hypothetical protein